jgi:hypothetical protein
MKSAVMKGDFNGFLRTVCVDPVDSQNNWRRRQFMDTVASWLGSLDVEKNPKRWYRVGYYCMQAYR